MVVPYVIAGNQDPRLYIPPETVAFGPADADRLRRHLAALDRATSTPHASSAASLQLDDDGILQGGYRYTKTAFKQVCALLSPGLYQYAVDMSGMYRMAHQPRGDYSFAIAVKTFNLALSQRFRQRLHGSVRLLKNRDTMVVEGVLGPKYNYLGNADILDLAAEAVSASTTRTRFHESVLSGRRIMIRFVHARPLFRLDTPSGVDEFSGGYHVSNSEIGGEASVRAAVLLLRASSGTVALGKFPGRGGLAHTGKDFHKKLNRMFQSLLAQEQDAGDIASRMRRLIAEPLGVDGGESTRAARVEFLSLLLHRRNVQRGLARRIVISAMQAGASPAAGVIRPLTRDMLATRTMWDLYNALTREASTATLTVRETVEQAAYALLMGHIRPR